MCVSVCVGGGEEGFGWSLLSVHYLVSSFAIISLEKKESWMLYFNCFLMSFDNWCHLSFPCGALGLLKSFLVILLTFHVISLSLFFKYPRCKHDLQGSAVS